MAFGWGDVGAIVGGAGGFLLGGPAGAAVGASLGGELGSGFDSRPGAPQYHDPYAGQVRAAIDQQFNSRVGAQTATATAGQIRNEASKEYRDIAENPNFAGNASVQSTAYNKIQRQAEGSMIDANLKGAEFDQRAHNEAVQNALGQGQFDFKTWQANTALSREPSPLDTILAKGIGEFVGSAGKKFGSDLLGDSSSSSSPTYGSGGSVNSDAINNAVRDALRGNTGGYGPIGG